MMRAARRPLEGRGTGVGGRLPTGSTSRLIGHTIARRDSYALPLNPSATGYQVHTEYPTYTTALSSYRQHVPRRHTPLDAIPYMHVVPM